jgi:ketosteroid isomerase-like protein
MNSGQVSDELEIAALLNAYARAVDTKDWQLYRSVFTDDAHIDYSAAVFKGSLDEAIEFFDGDFSALVMMSMHYITNVESEIDGDTARVRAMFYNPTQIKGVGELSMFGGYYFHDLVRTPDGWRSRHLREENGVDGQLPAGHQLRIVSTAPMLARLPLLVAFVFHGADDDFPMAHPEKGFRRQFLEETVEAGAELIGGADEVEILGLVEPQGASGGLAGLEVDPRGEELGPGRVPEPENDLLLVDRTCT